jgi:phosphoenolpyruvate carboxykinase (ATP)
VRFFQYNTGGLGEIIEEREEDGVKKKHFVKKAARVPIKLMAAIQRGDLKGINGYEPGMFGTGQIARVEGQDLSKYDPRNFYSQEEIDYYLADIVEGRMKYTETIAAEGLRDEVMEAAERSFRIMPKRKDKAFVSAPPEGGGREGGKEGPGGEGEEEESPVERFWKPAGRMPAPPRHRNR